MLKKLHWSLLRALPFPFAAAFGTLVFLLLMQFLFEYLPKIVGRGLPAGVVAELIAYSLAYMVTLAAPMAWLIALLAAFGRLSESRGYLVVKSSGISLLRLSWPVFGVGVLLAVGMAYFNNQMLPEANYRMNGLWRDIRVSRPAFALEPGVFYTGIDGYAIRAEAIPTDSAGLLLGVTVYQDRAPGGGQAFLTAARARLQTQYGGQRLTMLLEDGQVHLRRPAEERYERLSFGRHRLAFDLSAIGFERRETESGRTDRTMRTTDMLAVVDSLESAARARSDSVRVAIDRLGRTPGLDVYGGMESRGLRLSPTDSVTAHTATPEIGRGRTALDGLGDGAREAVYDLATRRAQIARSVAQANATSATFDRQRADRYRVEVYKKNSIALACLVFVLVGIPLGLSMARAGVGLVAVLAVFVFLFYWVTLVVGEKLADSEIIPPWLGMWIANVVIGVLGLYLFTREARDPAGRDPVRWLAGRFVRKGG